MKSNIYTLFFIVFTMSLNAQTYSSSGFFSLKLQGLIVDFSDFNEKIGDASPMLKDEIVGIGFDFSYRVNKLTSSLGFSTYRGFQANRVSLKETILNGYAGNAGIEYTILSKKSFEIQPFIEWGIRQYYLTLSETINYSLVDIINQDVKNYKFKNYGVYSDLGIGATQYFKVPNMKIGINLSVGYRFDLGEWKYEGVNTISDEISNMNGVIGVFKVLMIPELKNVQKL